MIEKCLYFLNNDFNIKVYFIKKNGRDNFSAFLLPNSIDNDIKCAYKQNIINIITGKELVDYDFVYDKKSSIAKVDATNLEVKTKILDLISDENRNFLNKNNFSDDYSYIVLELEQRQNETVEKIYLFSKYVKTQSWYKKGFLIGFLTNATIKKEQNIIVLNGNVDSILLGNDMLVLNSSAFEDIFNYYEEAKKLVENHKNDIVAWNFLTDGNQFYEKVKATKTRTKELANALLKSRTDWNNINAETVKNVLESDERFASISFDENNKIIYNDSNVDLIINLIREVYSRQLFTNNIIETKGV